MNEEKNFKTPCPWITVGVRLQTLLGEPAKLAIREIANAWFIESDYAKLMYHKYLAQQLDLAMSIALQDFYYLCESLKKMYK